MNIKRLSILLAVLISLISILTTAQAAPSFQSGGCVRFYSGTNYSGSYDEFCNTGTYSGGGGESLRVGPDTQVRLYAHPDCKAPLMDTSSNIADLSILSCGSIYCGGDYNWANATSCLSIVDNSGGGGGGGTAPPDLKTRFEKIITSQPYYAGTDIVVQTDVKNYGDSNAGSSTVAFWIAASKEGPSIDGQIKTRSVSSLAAGAKIEDIQVTLTIPATLVPGNTYYVIYVADYNDNVDEGADEDNNIDDRLFEISVVLSTPTNLQATDGSHTDKIVVSWDAVAGASGYELWRHTTNSSASATKIADVSGTSYNDTSATAGTTYYYWVKAKSGSSTSDFSNADSGLRTAITAPDAPTLSAINNPDGDGNYTVSWGAVTGATSYEYQAANNASFTSPQDGSTSGTSWNITGQSDGTYYYRVRTCDTLCSAWSNVQSVTVCQTPSLPTNPAPSHNATNQAITVNLSWGNDGSGATPASYDLYFGTAASPPLLATVTGSSYDLPNLTDSTPYNWRLVAKTACGGSSNGPVWTFTTAAPSAGSYNISGTVKDNAGNPLSGVTVSFNGARPNVTTGPTGEYTQSGFNDGSYTVSPSKAGYSFTAQSVTVSGSDKTGVDFVSTPENYSISGKVTDSSGNPLSGVTISFGGARPAVTTDVNGQYNQSGFGSGSYTVTPNKTGYNFTSRSVTISGANQANINFSGSLVSYSISGKVTDSAGNPLSGVTISFGGARPDVTTNVSGQYNQTGFLNGSYSVTATKTGYTFTGQTVNVNNGNQTGIDFAGAVATYTISGYVKDSSNNPLSGVTISFNGAADDVTTDDTGYYSQSGFSNGTYQVIPTKGGQTFNNTPRSVTVNGADVPNVNFVSYAAIPFDLHISDLLVTNADSGTVIQKGSTIAPGTKIELRAWVENKGPGNGGSVDLYYYDNNAYIDDDRTTSLDAGEVDDEYEKFTVSSTGQHILKVVIDPENEYEETNEGNNERTFRLNVEESANTYSISGRVTDGSGNGLANITVSFGGLRPSVTTNSSGNYSQSGFANGSYTVIPSGGSCPFSPASQSVTISGGNGSANFSLNCGTDPIWAASPVGSPEINVTIIGSGSSDYQSVQYRNTGNMTWLDYGTDRVVLSYRREDSDTGGIKNGDGKWESAFRCANWPSQSRYWAATISPASVSPNSTGSFTMQFCNRNNETPGEYVEHFDIAYGGEWFNDQGWTGRVTVRITVLPEDTIPEPTPIPVPTPWAAEVLGTKIFNVTIKGNGGISDQKVTVQYKNTGQNSWRNVGTEPVVLSYRHDFTTDGGYENSPGNWESAFRCEGMWPDDNPYWAAKVAPDGVATNSTGTFEMFFCNNRNKTPGTYTERFDVAHGGTWFYDAGWSDEVIVQVTVVDGDVDTYSISGEVLDDDSNGVANVTINFSDGRTTTTGSNGSYSLSGFVDGSTYTVTPSKSGYSFIPPSRERMISGRNETNVSFIGRGSSSGCSDNGEPYTIDSNLKQVINVTGDQLDDFIRSKRPDSPLIGLGDTWIRVGEQYGIDAIFLMSLSIHESGWGTNNLAKQKNNIYSWNAYDRCPLECADGYPSKEFAIEMMTPKINDYYLTPGGRHYNGTTLQKMNIKYATDKVESNDPLTWADKIVWFMNEAAEYIELCTGDMTAPTGKFITPNYGQRVGNSIPIEITAGDGSGNGVAKVELIVIYKGEKYTATPLEMSNLGSNSYGITLDVSARQDQDIHLGFNIYDNTGNTYFMPENEYLVVVKDTAGFLAEWVTQSHEQIELLAGGDAELFEVIFKNIGSTSWSNTPYGTNNVGLYENDEPNETCTGSNGKNAFEKFQFIDPYYDMSPPIGPYGVALANENSVHTGQNGTFAFRIAAPKDTRSGIYIVNLALHHNAHTGNGNWVATTRSDNSCDYFARTWFKVKVINPNEPTLPYIHQIKSTEDSFHGWGSCGASSLGMMLAWYDVLEPKPTIGSGVFESAYGWYVSNQFGEFDIRGYDLKSSFNTCTGGKFYGLNGFINPVCDYSKRPGGPTKYSTCGCGAYQGHVDNIGLAASKLMPVLMNGSSYYWNNASETVIRNAVERDNHLVVMSTRLCNVGGHYVLVRGYENGKFIVSDPQGRCNGNKPSHYSVYADGKDVRYSWSELKAKGWYVEARDPLRDTSTLLNFGVGRHSISRNGDFDIVSLNILETGRDTEFFSQTISLNSTSIPLTGVTPGLYHISLKPQYQLASQETVPIYGDSITINPNYDTIYGDIDNYGGDNVINLLDLASLITHWEQDVSQEVSWADLNDDNLIDQNDVSLLLKNYGEHGQGTIGATSVITGDSKLILSSEQTNYTVGDMFTVTVDLETSGYSYGTEVVINYDPNVLEVQDADVAETGVQISQSSYVYETYLENQVMPDEGKIILAGYNLPDTVPGYMGEFADITFKAIEPARESQINIDFTLGATTDSNVIVAGNLSDTLVAVNNLTLKIDGTDTTPPTGTLTVAERQKYIKQSLVALELQAEDNYSDISQMRFGFDGDIWSEWETYTYHKELTLPESDGAYSVFANVMDEVGNSTILSITVVLDTVSPTGTVKFKEIDEDDWVVFRIYPANDDEIVKMLISHSPSFDDADWGDFLAYDLTFPVSDGNKIYIKLMDKAGNISDVITFDVPDSNNKQNTTYLPLITK